MNKNKNNGNNINFESPLISPAIKSALTKF